jgi:hypothetical protein
MVKKNTTIAEAITSKGLISFYFDSCFRKVEPYRYGLNCEGKQVLLAYQTQAQGEALKERGGWKTFPVTKISNLGITGESFDYIRPDFNTQPNGMKRIICSL